MGSTKRTRATKPGYGAEGGHKQMWFAARDIAFEQPTTEDETERMLQRLGITTGGGGSTAPPRLFPDDVAVELELLIERMVRLLLIEVSAYHTFAWAEELLADRELVAGDGEAAKLVSYIRTDESPHVEYLRTTLSEMRDRTLRRRRRVAPTTEPSSSAASGTAPCRSHSARVGS